MKTIKELFDEHGSVWLSWPQTPNVKQFKPLGFTSDQKYIIGELFRDRVMCWPYDVDEKGFVLHQEVKQKKKYYQYAVKYKNVKMPLLTHGMYSAEKEFKEASEDFAYLEEQEIEWIKRIEPGIEVEE